MNMKDKLGGLSRKLKSEIKFHRLVLADPRTPKSAKLLLGMAIFYALLPFDLVPDFLPVIGYLDDLIIVGGLAMLAMRLIPKELVKENRERIAGMDK